MIFDSLSFVLKELKKKERILYAKECGKKCSVGIKYNEEITPHNIEVKSCVNSHITSL